MVFVSTPQEVPPDQPERHVSTHYPLKLKCQYVFLIHYMVDLKNKQRLYPNLVGAVSNRTDAEGLINSNIYHK